MLSPQQEVEEEAQQGQGAQFGQNLEALWQQQRQLGGEILRGPGASKGQERWSVQARLL